jgi:hypothetical protein
MAPRGCGFEQDCSQCHEPEIRKQWGCDEPTAEPLFWLEPCPFCAGKQQACAHCDGTNKVAMHRCPNALATQVERDMLTAAALVEHGVLPEEGGFQDQAATFCQAYPLAMQEIVHWRAVAADRARKGLK